QRARPVLSTRFPYTTLFRSDRFDITIYLHQADREWIMRPSDRITFWSGETYPLQDGMTLLRLGGHFLGGTVLHWQQGADGKGALDRKSTRLNCSHQITSYAV